MIYCVPEAEFLDPGEQEVFNEVNYRSLRAEQGTLPIPDCFRQLACSLATGSVAVLSAPLIVAGCNPGSAALTLAASCFGALYLSGSATGAVQYATLTEDDDPRDLLCHSLTGGLVKGVTGPSGGAVNIVTNKQARNRVCG